MRQCLFVTALAMMTKLQRIQIGMVTSLDKEDCRLIGIERWTHKNVSAHLSGQQKEKSIGFIANASLTVKKSQVPDLFNRR
jgi:hypothetical protein